MSTEPPLAGYGTHLRDGMKVNLRFVRKKTVASGLATWHFMPVPEKPIAELYM